MIAQLSGKFLYKTPTQVIVDVQGVGYLVSISLNTYAAIEQQDQGSLFIYTKVAEDAISLYGFALRSEQELFEKLIGVNGVGTNTARMMLSHMRPDELSGSIARSDVAALEKIKGIGKKTAERIVLELRGKMGALPTGGAAQEMVQGNSMESDALEALVALGIPRPAASAAIKKVSAVQDTGLSVEGIIKAVLKSL